MSDQEDLFEAECVNSAKVNRRALKRKAENIANREIQKLIAQKEKVACEREIHQGNFFVPGRLCDLNSQTSSMLRIGSNILLNETEAISNPDSSSNALLQTASAGFPMSPFRSAVESIDSLVETKCVDESFSKKENEIGDFYSSDREINDSSDDYETDDDDELGQVGAHEHLYLPLLSVAHYLKNRQTKKSLSTHLKIQQLTTGSRINELTSTHKLLSKYKKISKTCVNKVQVCRKKSCPEILQVDSKNVPLSVQACSHNQPETQGKRACYVLHVSVEQQLVHFIRQHGLRPRPSTADDVRSDVESGDYYRELRNKGLIDDNTITLQLNTDGVEKFNVSNYSFWPLMALINEVPYHIRRNFIILLALWFGNRKPPRKAFMEQSIAELKHLQMNGFEVDGRLYKVRVLVITTDTMARPVLKNTSQFNGAFGCDWCLLEGKVVKKGKGHTRVYPELKTRRAVPQKRTIAQHLRDTKAAISSKKPVHGVIGPTPLSNLPDFDFIRASVPDYMHAGCQGVIKHFIQLFTSSDWKKKPWFMNSQDIENVNRRLASSKPPYEIKRTLVDIADLTDWKASMYRSFLIYHFQLLEGILPPEYFRHFADLAYGFSTLLQKEVKVEDVKKVDVLMKTFVKDMERLYGVEHIRINIHFLTHFAQCVLDLGCLWATSNFIPEGFNGELKNLSKGTVAVVEQMAENYLMLSEVRREAVGLVNQYPLPPGVVQLLKELLHLPDNLISSQPSSSSGGLLVNDGAVRLLGKPVHYSCTVEEEVALLNLFNSDKKFHQYLDLNLNDCVSHSRFQLTSTRSIFTTTTYTRSKKSINYCALLQNGEFVIIERILNFIIGQNQRSFFLFKQLGSISKKDYTPDPIGTVVFKRFPGQLTKLFGVSPILLASDYEQISSKCVVSYQLPSADLYVAAAIINPFETD